MTQTVGETEISIKIGKKCNVPSVGLNSIVKRFVLLGMKVGKFVEIISSTPHEMENWIPNSIHYPTHRHRKPQNMLSFSQKHSSKLKQQNIKMRDPCCQSQRQGFSFPIYQNLCEFNPIYTRNFHRNFIIIFRKNTVHDSCGDGCSYTVLNGKTPFNRL